MMAKSKKWLSEWNKTIGGSRAPAVLGKSKWQSRLEVAEQMRMQAPLAVEDNSDMKRGRLLEPIARKLLREAMGQKVKTHSQNIFLYNPDYPFAHCLPDGWCAGSPIEIKWPRPMNFEKIRMNGLSSDYVIQAQHNIAVTGADKLFFAVCCCVTMDIVLVPVQRDDAFISEMIEKEAEFFELVKSGAPLDNLIETTATEIEVPEYSGEMVYIADPTAVSAARVYLEADEVYQEAESLRKEAIERLKLAGRNMDAFEIREESTGNEPTPILRCYNHEQQGRQTFDHKAAVSADPALAKYYKTGNPFTTFRAYDLSRRKFQ